MVEMIMVGEISTDGVASAFLRASDGAAADDEAAGTNTSPPHFEQRIVLPARASETAIPFPHSHRAMMDICPLS